MSIDPNLWKTKTFADYIYKSVRRVQQLTQEGVLKTTKVKVNGHTTSRYDMRTELRNYISFLDAELEKKQEQIANRGSVNKKLEAEIKFKEAKAEIEQLKLKELRGELHKAEDVEAITTDLVFEWRSIMMALPGQLAVDVANCDDPAECADIIKAAVYQGMSNIANYRYDPEKYAERVREREGWKEINLDEDE